jgi:hypothetical protein
LFFAARFACHAAQAVRVTMAKNAQAWPAHLPCWNISNVSLPSD